MNNATGVALLEHCRTIALDWSRQQFNSYLQYLDAGLLRGALAASDEDDQLALFRHHKRLKSLLPKAEALFCDALEQALARNAPCHAENRSTESLKELNKLFKECCGIKGVIFCQSLHAEQYIAYCRQCFQQCDFEPVAEAFALGLFHEYYLATLPDLYAQLNVVVLEKLMTPSVSSGLDDWIRHLESTLNDRSLDTARRSLAQARLDELRKQRRDLNRKQPLRRPSIAERWQNPYPENEKPASRKLSDLELTKEARKLFKPLLDNPQLPREVQTLTNRMYPLLVEAALAERELFMNPLHPHRQMVNHMVATVKHWHQSSPEEQLHMLDTLRSLAQTNLQCFQQNPSLREKLLDSVNYYCHEARERIKHEGRPNMAPDELRRQVHQLLCRKMAGNTCPPVVDKLLLGPWTRVIIYHWSLGRANSAQLKKAVAVADDVLRYCDKTTTWTQDQKQKLETSLKEGLASIEMDPLEAQHLLIALHKVRLHLEKQQKRSESTQQQAN